MAASVEELLQQHPARLWRAREQTGSGSSAPAGLSTGYAALDRCLPGQGWPQQGLIEILSDQPGIGELALLMPALAQLCSPASARVRTSAATTTNAGGWIAWVSPPHVPYAPALAAWGLNVERMLVVHANGSTEWAMEQALRSEACSAVLGWANPREPQALRRLQLAAEQSRTLAVLFRGRDALKNPSPAVLRVTLRGGSQGLEVRLVKSRGGRPTTVTLRDPT
jgi:cell division inhibitor SulA/protein ImuA